MYKYLENEGAECNKIAIHTYSLINNFTPLLIKAKQCCSMQCMWG
jgi:hypothetical protein